MMRTLLVPQSSGLRRSETAIAERVARQSEGCGMAIKPKFVGEIFSRSSALSINSCEMMPWERIVSPIARIALSRSL